VSKLYEVHFAKIMQTTSTMKQKTQTTYEHALANTSTYGGIEPLKLAIPPQVTYKINPSEHTFTTSKNI
jgi:hypothetical protein